ncbi:hypothetical protein [Spirosoma utsteinense]|uniref:Uncharacterized protein n=1 Tax=Spirosoma utsteinense TaxID=2585773 RepID=A0ABR6W7P5_9BACT|nr:hypothetical protein [Spirosoma utsteinense]MBC3783972.1 hypothetical protein [Spirosoma utsteinense]MBC3792607.1 hypothetical protein [Spirosoma utsteinense]
MPYSTHFNRSNYQKSCAYKRKDSRGFVWAWSLNRFDRAHFSNYRFDEPDTTTIGKGEIQAIG